MSADGWLREKPPVSARCPSVQLLIPWGQHKSATSWDIRSLHSVPLQLLLKRMMLLQISIQLILLFWYFWCWFKSLQKTAGLQTYHNSTNSKCETGLVTLTPTIHSPCVVYGLGMGSKFSTFMGTYQIPSIVPRTDSCKLKRYHVLVPEHILVAVSE